MAGGAAALPSRQISLTRLVLEDVGRAPLRLRRVAGGHEASHWFAAASAAVSLATSSYVAPSSVARKT